MHPMMVSPFWRFTTEIAFPSSADQPYRLCVLEDQADLCLSGFRFNQQQGPSLDLGPADNRGMGCTLPVDNKHLAADGEVGEVGSLAVREKDIGMDGPCIHPERAGCNVRVLQRLGMDEQHGRRGVAHQHAFAVVSMEQVSTQTRSPIPTGSDLCHLEGNETDLTCR